MRGSVMIGSLCTAALAAAVLAVAVMACGGEPTPAPTAPTAAVEATPAAPGDAIVARVDGHPIYASCVTAQAAHDHTDARAALRACIDFELLAIKAAARGLVADAEVDDARRTAMVNRLIEREFEGRTFTQADFGSMWPQIVQKLGPRVDHPEFRASAYARVPVDPKADAAADAAAHAVADQIAAAVAGKTGLFAVDLVDVATPIAAAANARLDHATVPAFAAEGLDAQYGAALFAIPDIGRTSPAVRTKWGWDIVLFTSDVPAAHPSADAYTAALVAEARSAYFKPWVDTVAHGMNLTITTDKDGVAQLEDVQ
jgi:hypothetical protein